MLFTENVLLALAGLKSNIMRSLLTMLGIIIGIASVIAIMTVGNSITVMVNTTMQEMGANNLTIGVSKKSSQSNSFSFGGLNFGVGNTRNISSEDLISEEMFNEFYEQYADNIDYVLLEESIGSGTAKDGSLYANVNVVGYNKDYMTYTNNTLLAGRDFLEEDYEEGRKVCIVSDYFVSNMFDGDNSKALGQPIEVTINNKYYTYYIVGVYEYSSEEYSSDSKEDTTTTLYIPYEAARKQNHTTSGYQSITIVTSIDTDNTSFATTVEDYYNTLFYSKNDDYEVTVTSMASMMDSVTSMISTIELALAIIAGISLVVGGIGVMNIMLVSITERTKEIGTRKALGATNSSIRLQFITESVVICVIGGIIGIILGAVLGSIAITMVGYTAAISVSSVFIAVGFSMFIGIFFGYYPANKAAKLNPIDALRYE